MDGDHDIETCEGRHPPHPASGVQRTGPAARRPGRHGAEAEHGDLRHRQPPPGFAPCRKVARAHAGGVLEDLLRRPRRAGHRLPLRRPERRGRHRPPRRHEQDGPAAVEAHLLLRPRPAGRAAEGLVRQAREHRLSPTRLRSPRADEQPRQPRANGKARWKRRPEGGAESCRTPVEQHLFDAIGSGLRRAPGAINRRSNGSCGEYPTSSPRDRAGGDSKPTKPSAASVPQMSARAPQRCGSFPSRC